MSYHRPAPPPLQQQPIPVSITQTQEQRARGFMAAELYGVFAAAAAVIAIAGGILVARSEQAIPLWLIAATYCFRQFVEYSRGRL